MVTGPSRRDFRVQKVIQALNKDPSCPLPELAGGCEISVSRLSHLFKDEIGINLKNYRRDCRLQVAAVMLTSTSMSIKEIAYAARYRHTSSFVRAFKIHHGLSPAHYRQVNQTS